MAGASRTMCRPAPPDPYLKLRRSEVRQASHKGVEGDAHEQEGKRPTRRWARSTPANRGEHRSSMGTTAKTPTSVQSTCAARPEA